MADDTYSRGHRNPPGRGGTGADGPAVDPLTELARLIGQSDPFAAVDQRRANSRAAEASRPPAEWPGEPSHHDQPYDDRAQDAHYAADHRDYPPEYDRQAPADPGYGYDDPHDAYVEQPYDAHPDGGAARYDEGYETDPHDEHPDDPSRFHDDEPAAPRRRGWMLTAVGLISLSIVGAAAAFAYHKVFREGAPSIIARDPGPNKIIPSSQTADSRTNKRVDRIATNGVDERLVSREEQPVPLPDTRGAEVGQTSRVSPFTTPAPPSLPTDIATGSAGAPDSGPGPRRIQTVRVPPDTSAPNPLASGPSVQSPLSPPPVAPRPTPPRATAAQAPTQPTPLQLAPQGTPAPPPQGAAPLSLSAQTQVATASPPPHPRAPATAAAEAGSGYYVQVTAQRSEEEAQSSFRGIQAKYENLLGAHQPVIRKKDLGAKGIFYGAQIGPLSHDEALQLCQSLKSAGAPCMMQKN